MPDSFSIIDLGKLSEPATVLIQKISDAVGGIFKPHQIKRIAKAEAKADLINAGSQIQVTELHRRAMHRFIEEEAQKQSNIENITNESLPLLEDNAAPQDVENDWITNFFDKCRIVSDKEMQLLWSKVLAGEANNPGTFSRRTVNLMSDLDKQDAELFQSLCRFNWVIVGATPLMFDTEAEIYAKHGLHFGVLSHLDTLGLIQLDDVRGFARGRLPKRLTVSYYGKPLELTLRNDKDNQLEIGHVMLTQAGQELVSICGSQPIPEYFDYVRNRWIAQKLIDEEATEQTDEPEPE